MLISNSFSGQADSLSVTWSHWPQVLNNGTERFYLETTCT